MRTISAFIFLAALYTLYCADNSTNSTNSTTPANNSTNNNTAPVNNSTTNNTTPNNSTTNNSTNNSTTNNSTTNNSTTNNSTTGNSTNNNSTNTNKTSGNSTDNNSTKKNGTEGRNKTIKKTKGEKQYGKMWAVDASLGGEDSRPIPEVLAIQTDCFVKLQYIIGFMTNDEQKLCVAAFKANNNSETCLDFSTINSTLRSVREKIVNDTGNSLTQRSVDARVSMGCLMRAAKDVDANYTGIANKLQPIAREQGMANRATAAFSKKIMNLITLRWKFISASIKTQKDLGVLDKDGIYEGFVYTDSEMNQLVDSFRDYAYEQYEYRVVFLDTMTQSMRDAANLFNARGCGKGKKNDTQKNDTKNNGTSNGTTN
jgi:hypothetical protein